MNRIFLKLVFFKMRDPTPGIAPKRFFTVLGEIRRVV